MIINTNSARSHRQLYDYGVFIRPPKYKYLCRVRVITRYSTVRVFQDCCVWYSTHYSGTIRYSNIRYCQPVVLVLVQRILFELQYEYGTSTVQWYKYKQEKGAKYRTVP